MSTTEEEERKDPPIGVFRALRGAFMGEEFEYYPRTRSGAGGEERIASKELLRVIQEALKDFKFNSDETKSVDAKTLIDRAKDSLEEVKKQTEYQDAKAGRLLTIIAFLTAAVGIVFGKFVDLYPLHRSAAAGGITLILVTLVYGLLAAYLVCIASGAMVIFHAMSTRFVWPAAKNLADRTTPASFLFFQEIVRTKPEAWGNAFASDENTLLAGYYRNYVAEAYLVAAKVADKLRYLDPGQRLLLTSIRLLLAAFVALIVTFVVVEPTSSNVTLDQMKAAPTPGLRPEMGVSRSALSATAAKPSTAAAAASNPTPASSSRPAK